MKKLLDLIWEPFDSGDSIEWFLLLFGWTVLITLILGTLVAGWT